MNLFELFVKIVVDDQASGKISSLSNSLKGGLATAAKIGTAAVGAAATGIAALTTAAVNNYAEYEQLVGGVETLFGNSSKKIQEYAANAYKTAGVSANEYMSTVTSFSASLLQSLGGDTEAAAEYANQALIDMSDNANKMGTDMSMIQNAYQGFAKQNYTMLDNLKLGYGGTKEEMARLIEDAAELSDTVDAQSLSFSNIVEAIHVVQTEMGITGTTAQEASSTISGSVNSMKSAWSNLVTGLADDNAEFDVLINNFVESVTIAGENIIPRVEVALTGVSSLIDSLFPVIMAKIPEIITSTLPQIASAAVSIVESLVGGISGNLDQIVETTISVINTLIDGVIDMLPEIVVTGALLLGKLAVGLIQAIPELVMKIPEIISAIVQGFSERGDEFKDVGLQIVQGIWEGIKGAGGWLLDKIGGFFSGIVDSAKETLGIHSPSRVFADIGKNMALGVGEGWNDEFKGVKGNINGSVVQGWKKTEGKTYGLNASQNPVNIVIETVLDGAVLARKTYKHNQTESMLRGNSLVEGVV